MLWILLVQPHLAKFLQGLNIVTFSHWKLSSTSFERESFREIAKKKVASHVGKSSAPVYQGK